MDMSIRDRMKEYEDVSNHYLLSRTPVFIRVDGRAFHSFTKGMEKPFDLNLINAMLLAGQETAKEMMGFKLGYHQSDEFTFMMLDTDSLETQPWFGNNMSKIISITTSIFTSAFNSMFLFNKKAQFDCRAFNVPLDDAPNVFIWRQHDWERNSLQMLARSKFSHKQLEGKNSGDIHNMLHEIGLNWADLPNVLKNGSFLTKEGNLISNKLDYSAINDLIHKEKELSKIRTSKVDILKPVLIDQRTKYV